MILIEQIRFFSMNLRMMVVMLGHLEAAVGSHNGPVVEPLSVLVR